MSRIFQQTETCVVEPNPSVIVDSFLQSIRDGQTSGAVELFADAFTFNDYGLLLCFTDKERLANFFDKQVQLCPDLLFTVDAQFSDGGNVSLFWTMKASVSEPGFGGRVRVIPVIVQGASFIRIQGEKIIEWADYYDGLTSRRQALAEYFRDWIEY